MKDIDVLNIRRALEYRKIKPDFKDGGDLSFEEINSRSTEELEIYSPQTINQLSPKLKH